MSIAFPKELFAAVQEVYNFVLAPVENLYPLHPIQENARLSATANPPFATGWMCSATKGSIQNFTGEPQYSPSSLARWAMEARSRFET